jgi:hypothetical protein
VVVATKGAQRIVGQGQTSGAHLVLASGLDRSEY